MFIVAVTTYAQVGIGTTAPKSSLEIKTTNQVDTLNTDGILIPRVDDFPANDLVIDQKGMLVFAPGNEVPGKGLYFWDNSNELISPLVFEALSQHQKEICF